jgi:hypothetical protein
MYLGNRPVLAFSTSHCGNDRAGANILSIQKYQPLRLSSISRYCGSTNQELTEMPKQQEIRYPRYYKTSLRADQRYLDGICWFCDNKRDPDSRLCAECRKKHRIKRIHKPKDSGSNKPLP